MWPGYLTTSRLLADGIFLNMDTCTKFINKVTCLDQIYALLDNGRTHDQIARKYDSSNLDESRKTVITSYNTKSYQVDGLDFSKNPDTYVFKQKDGSSISMYEYIFKTYKIKLRERKQPLLYCNFKDTRVYLPTELCHEAALPENFTSDSRKMKDLQDYKISGPTERFERLAKVLSRIVNMSEFAQFEIKLKTQEHIAQGKVLHPPSLRTEKGRSSWEDYTGRRVKHADPANLQKEKWVLMYGAEDYDRANKCVDGMREACGGFGIKVDDPEYIEVDSNNSRQRDGVGYVKHCDGFPFANYKFVLVVIRDPKHKKAIKAFLDKKNIASQFVLGNTIDRAKLAVYSNVLKQINAKIA